MLDELALAKQLQTKTKPYSYDYKAFWVLVFQSIL